ncbi:type IV toxin-antitoxin system AbiEi family antitoxin domain-containing protein [Corynebacterium riegelii]
MHENEREWLSYRQAAERYGISERTLNRMVKAGEVTTTRRRWTRPSVYLDAADISTALRRATA